MTQDITEGLNASERSVPAALYASLRRLAQQQLSRQSGNPTLNATALVNEAWIKVAGGDHRWQSRQHFLAAMARHAPCPDRLCPRAPGRTSWRRSAAGHDGRTGSR
ncbi:MAG: hypothetical protein IPK97_20880 [Ahniella sp.]|nr:hypothetical protein [Ahniella sp.]